MISASWGVLFATFLSVAVTVSDAKAAAGDLRTISRTDVNIRSGPSLDDPILTVVNPGETMIEIAQKDGWYRIEFPDRNREGWIYGPLLDSLATLDVRTRASAPLATKTERQDPLPTQSVAAVGHRERESVQEPSGGQEQTFAALIGGSFAGDPARGEKVFYKCGSCHTVTPGINAQGPSLVGVFGNAPAQAPGFGYSTGMRAFAAEGAIWDEATLDEFIRRPARKVRGTSMPFSGVRDPNDRRDLIAFLRELGT